MRANELRIGNYVNVPRKEQSPFRVDYFDNVKVYQDNGTYECTPIGEIPMHPLTWDLADIEGIPLTPEILEKCGFILRNSFHPTYHFGESDTVIELLLNPDGKTWMTKIYNNYSESSTRFVMIKNTKYLHELQNLIHALTGEELEVKL